MKLWEKKGEETTKKYYIKSWSSVFDNSCNFFAPWKVRGLEELNNKVFYENIQWMFK
jgi:hypothetical protein